MLNAEFDVLKTIWSVECCRRHEDTTVPSAFATVAGAGPNSSAVVMKNVSETVMLAETDPVFIENDPVSSASAAKSSHSYRCGRKYNETSDWTTASVPATATN